VLNEVQAPRRPGAALLRHRGLPAGGSYGSCVVITDDIEPLFDAFAAGLRAAYGKLPVSGFPRITRPRRRKNNDNRTGFSLVDPSGNWIRVTAERSPVESSSDAQGAGCGRPSTTR
jgi:hypothetical protein